MDTSCVKIKVLPPTDESVDDIIENSAKEQLKNLKEKYRNYKKENKNGTVE
jgi:hypothetical protein